MDGGCVELAEIRQEVVVVTVAFGAVEVVATAAAAAGTC